MEEEIDDVEMSFNKLGINDNQKEINELEKRIDNLKERFKKLGFVYCKECKQYNVEDSMVKCRDCDEISCDCCMKNWIKVDEKEEIFICENHGREKIHKLEIIMHRLIDNFEYLDCKQCSSCLLYCDEDDLRGCDICKEIVCSECSDCVISKKMGGFISCCNKHKMNDIYY